jgi:hypothetical protein
LKLPLASPAGDNPLTDKEQDALTRVIAKEAAKQAVDELMTRLGIDNANPLDMQRDMQWLRDTRVGSEKIKEKGVLTLIGAAVLGAATIIWIGIKQSLNGW